MTTKGTIKELPVAEIEATAATQVRVKKPEDKLVKEYAEAMSAGSIFPPIAVFAEQGSKRYLLADGFTRLESTKQIKCETITCLVREGGVHEALGFAFSANDEHGLRRTNADKRNAVMMALKDPTWCAWSNVDIGRLCKVSDKLVAKVREDLVLSGEIDDQETRTYTQDGKKVTRKSTTAKGSIRSNTSKKKKKSKASKGPKSQDQIDREEVLDAIDVINGRTYDGATALGKLKLQDHLVDVELSYLWLGEVLAASKEAAA